MSEEGTSSKDGSVTGAIKAVDGLLKNVPIYTDALQPAAKEVGTALGTVGKAVNAALLPVKGMVWGIEKISEFIEKEVAKRLEKVPAERIITPDPAIAGPVMQSLRFSGEHKTLCDMYANLLATSMDRNTATLAHPSFAEVIRNMSSDEGKLLQVIFRKNQIPLINIRSESLDGTGGADMALYFNSAVGEANCEHRELAASYFVNLERLGLIATDKGRYLSDPKLYVEIEANAQVQHILNAANLGGRRGELIKYYAEITPFGRQFANACLQSS